MASPITYKLADLVPTLAPPKAGQAVRAGSGTALNGHRPTVLIGYKSKVNAAARAGQVNINELRAAEPFVVVDPDYKSWEQQVLLPFADAIALAPEHEPGLREMFDRVSRRTADPAKASDEYFRRAHRELDKAIATRATSPRRASHIRLVLNALEHGYDPAAQVRASTAAAAAPFFEPIRFDQPDLHEPEWVIPGVALRGELSVLVSPGGGLKTTFMVGVAGAATAGDAQFGPFVINNKPGGLRVGFISGEEDAGRLGLLVAAAAQAAGMGAADRARVAKNLLTHDAAATGWRLGEPLPGQRDMAPEAKDDALRQLIAALSGFDLLVLDNLAVLLALLNENDNNAITTLLSRLKRAARHAGCAVILIHHTPKMTREAAALQRGESTLVRGGGAITNSARIALTITSPTMAESGQLIIQGHDPDRVRRIEHAKVNDGGPMVPSYFTIVLEQVKASTGRAVTVRAIKFIATPPNAGAGPTSAVHTLIMQTIAAGTTDDHGAAVPFSKGGGRANKRDAIPAITRALMNANPGLTEAPAKGLAREVLKDLIGRGCVVEEPCQLPQYKSTGQPNGTRFGQDLVARWDRLPAPSTDIPGAERCPRGVQ